MSDTSHARPGRRPDPPPDGGRHGRGPAVDTCARLLASIEDAAIVAVDPSGRVVGWSAGAARLTGYAAEEIEGRPIGELYEEPWRDAWPVAALAEAEASGRLEERAWRRRKDGTRFLATSVTRPARDAEGRLLGYCSVWRDVTTGATGEERLRLLDSALAAANDAVMITEADPIVRPGPRIVYANDAFTRMTGYSAAEAIGRSPHFLQGPETDPGTRAKIRAALERKEPVRAELRNYRKDGTPFWVELNIVPVRDETGRVTHFASVQRETTGRREWEERRRRLTEELRAIFEASPLAIIVLDPDGRVERWNPAAERIFGWTEAEVLGRPYPLSREAERPEAEDLLRAALRGESVVGLETVRIRKDGAPVHVGISTAPLRDVQGRIAGTVAVLEDIGVRQRAEAEAEELRRYTAMIMDTVADGIFGVDREGRATFVNQAAGAMVGWEPGELLGKNHHALIHHTRADGEPYPVEECPISETLRDGRLHHVDGDVFWRRDGTGFPVEYTSKPLVEDGRITGAVVTFRDITERKRAEEALRESEERFRTIFEQAGIGIAIVEVEGGRIREANPAFQRMLGYTAEEMRGLPFPEVTHPDDIQTDWHLYTELTEGRRTDYQIEKRYIRKDGRVAWGRLTATLVRDTDGRPLSVIALIEDITERREAEEERRRLTAILEATPDFVGIADAMGRTLYVNRAGRRMIGIGQDDDISALTIADYHPSWAAELILSVGIPTAVREGNWSGETALLGRDGREIPVLQVIVSHRESEDGDVAYLSTVMRDISDRKEAEEAQHLLAEVGRVLGGPLEADRIARDLAELLVGSFADYCVIDLVDDNGIVSHAAGAHRDPDARPLVERLLKESPKGAPSRGVKRVLESGRAERLERVPAGWAAEEARGEEERRLLEALAPKSLLIVPMLVRGRPIGAIMLARSGDGSPFGEDDQTLAESIASRAALAIENARLYRESRQATRFRDEVLRIVAHDLRNPLNTIGLSAGVLEAAIPKEDGAEVEAARRPLEIIRRSVARANRLIEDLLDVARVEAGQLTIERRPVSATALLEEVLDLHRSLADEKDLTLAGEWPASLPQVAGDHDRLIQVFANLLGNAIKYTPPGGRIEVRAHPVGREAVRFEVSDNGPGIPPEDLPHLFDPFWQARRGPAGGAGLGLGIARGIVEALGGRIGVESRVGGGTTFWFEIPRA
jgi:PAS domain S-box-containing protein